MAQERCAAPDVGREAVYAAEESTFGGTDVDQPLALARLVARAAEVVDGTWWQSCGAPVVDVGIARADAVSSSARPSSRGDVVVRLACGQLTTTTLAHELAHALAGVAHGHDERFRAAHVDVVAVLTGGVLADVLRRTYLEHGVPPGARAWPPPHRLSGPGFLIVP
jgi:hypothetical protein